METRGNHILSLESLAVGFKIGRDNKTLFPAISLAATRGELIAVIGENGVGKSTLLRTICGLQSPVSGNVFLNGKDVNDYDRYELARNVAFISTEQVRVSNMTVTDLVRLGRYPHTGWTGKLNADDQAIVSESISKTGLDNLSHRYINELSDGERQRAMIARVLAQDAEILVMDEPTAFLDVRSRYEIIHLLHQLATTRNKTIIFSTHDLPVAISESDRIWLLFSDSMAEGSPEDLILNGNFNRLFSDSVVRFNTSDASFSFRREIRGSVRLDATGDVAYWTAKALARAGFSLSASSGYIVKAEDTGSGTKWTLTKENKSLEFKSVYDLVMVLSS
ncbi:MAG: ABC transporter ATP-binding protein [Bacteroidales bacterium]